MTEFVLAYPNSLIHEGMWFEYLGIEKPRRIHRIQMLSSISIFATDLNAWGEVEDDSGVFDVCVEIQSVDYLGWPHSIRLDGTAIKAVDSSTGTSHYRAICLGLLKAIHVFDGAVYDD